MEEVSPLSIQRDLDFSGWCWIEFASDVDIIRILSTLGPLIPSWKGGAYHQDLVPLTREKAPFASMSSITGTGSQPRHTDAAFFPCPPRYIALQCVEVGERPCPTHLWSLDWLRLRDDRPNILTDITWIASGGGHAPFYCSAMDIQSEDMRVRFDPICMRPISRSGDTVDATQKMLDQYSYKVDFNWKPGALLIINNWRCLHARGYGAAGAPSRRLRRWYVGACNGLVA